MAHTTHTATIKLKDGSQVDHTAEAIRFRHLSDGAVAVFATCCGIEQDGSWHTMYDLAKLPQEDIAKQVAAHVQRKAEHHAAVHLANDFMHTLIKEAADGK
jgi:hypothetical protein